MPRDSFGGGVALLILESLKALDIVIPKEITVEAVGATLKLGNDQLNFFGYYNPPKHRPNKKFFEF